MHNQAYLLERERKCALERRSKSLFAVRINLPASAAGFDLFHQHFMFVWSLLVYLLNPQ